MTASATATNTQSSPPQLVDKNWLEAHAIPYTNAHLLRLEKEKAFPARVRLGHRHVAWLRTEVEQFLADRIASRDRGVSA